MRRLLIGCVWGLVAYLLGACGGGYWLYLVSSNQHDRELEAAMTGAFVLGPLAALVGFLVGALRAKASVTGIRR